MEGVEYREKAAALLDAAFARHPALSLGFINRSGTHEIRTADRRYGAGSVVIRMFSAPQLPKVNPVATLRPPQSAQARPRSRRAPRR